MKNNAYFEEMKQAGIRYEEAKKALKEKKQQIIDTYGWDSEELKTWREEDAAVQMPYSQGAWKAYRAFMASDEVLELDDFLWEKEIADFSDALQAAGINEFICTNESTALMSNMHDLIGCGWDLAGIAVLTKENRWGETETKKGIRFSR